MSGTQDSQASGTPMHLWLVGVVSLLWNSMGAWGYYATVTKNDAYVQEATPELLAYFENFPAWAIACWATAVWGGVLGSLLLLLKKRLAAPVLLISFLAMIGTTVYNYGLSDGMEVMGSTGQLLFAGSIFLVSLLLVVYSRAMCKRGVLS